MVRRSIRVWIVQTPTLVRIVAALAFATIAFQHIPRVVLISLYATAMLTDAIDGYLAQRLNAKTYLGKILDLVSDKSFTIVSVLYAAARGVTLAPLSLIATREIIVLGMRLVSVRGGHLLPTNRVFGGLLAMLIWGTTLALISAESSPRALALIGGGYWLAAILLLINLALRVRSSRSRIRDALGKDE
jgi:phosphatidylglycerophosphate synthase